MSTGVKTKLPVMLLCGWCLALLAVRFRYSGSADYAFMVWNLFLAIIPVICATLFRALHQSHAARAAHWLFLPVWLAFLPNAPYLVTDLIHLRALPPVPLWYDVIMLGSFAATGLLLTYASLADVEAVLRERFGTFSALAFSVCTLAVCGFGIYLGRFMRWNTWDIVSSPRALFADIAQRFANPMSHPRTWAVTVLYGAGLVVGYVVLRSISASFAPPVSPRVRGAQPTQARRHATTGVRAR